MTTWLALLAGSVAFGAAVVAALVLPRVVAPLAAMGGVAALLTSVTMVGTIAQRYNTGEAIGAAMLILLAGIGGGFAVAASALPHLAPRSHTRALAEPTADASPLPAVILVSCTEPEKYSPRAVAARQNLLDEGAEIEVPTTALPFVFFAEKARYRAAGGRAPGPAAARRLAERVLDRTDGRIRAVDLAWCHAPGSLAESVASLARTGSGDIIVVVLGASESGPLDEARAALDRSLRDVPNVQVLFGSSVWNDRSLPSRLADRILASTVGALPSEVGVVLVDEGLPPTWARRYAGAGAISNYFDQRVRVLLAEAGIGEQRVRMAWLDWQTPDVTEAVRHLAALGCTRVVVAAATIALPTLETVLDLGHAIALARVPQEVHVVTVSPWADDEGFVDAVCRSALEPLGLQFPDETAD